ncbi:MAG: TetR/AcrR family transcriptional regulator [Anaerolineae bacterium]|nr:TetR/AcrR family transcriptional regulator [Anaerolineae bacterium]
MTGGTVDRRVQRTRQLLHDALIALILEKGYDEITVQDIIDRANIGRSTFYAHYLDKQDLLERGLERLREELGQNLARSDGAAGTGWAIVPALALFRHTGRHHHLFRAMIGGTGIELVVKTIDEALTAHAQARLDRLVAERGQPSIPPCVIAPYLVGALLALLTWWLDHDMPYPPERMDEMFRQLTAPAVSAIFGNVPQG